LEESGSWQPWRQFARYNGESFSARDPALSAHGYSSFHRHACHSGICACYRISYPFYACPHPLTDADTHTDLDCLANPSSGTVLSNLHSHLDIRLSSCSYVDTTHSGFHFHECLHAGTDGYERSHCGPDKHECPDCHQWHFGDANSHRCPHSHVCTFRVRPWKARVEGV